MQAGDEAQKKLAQERRARQASLENFYADQSSMLQEQLKAEREARAFREQARASRSALSCSCSMLLWSA